MSLNLSLVDKIGSLDSDDLTVSSDELDYQIDNIDLNKQILKSQYAIIKKIGKGSFANVWLAYDILNDNFVAIKVQHPDNYDEGIDELKFLMKIAKYNYRYINNIIDGFIHSRRDNREKKKYICMVFELLACNLYDIIKEGKYSNGLPINIVKSITLNSFVEAFIDSRYTFQTKTKESKKKKSVKKLGKKKMPSK